ncbi:MAG: DUF4339 domain-containing protein [Verrucomicrobia bacterium]|nr:DUF4339 domain-containing protein [Verrucomicrobiota bacterium]
MTEGIYYLKLGNQVEGPYTIGQIYDLWAARKINSQTLFARIEERDKWQPLAELTLTIAPPRPSTLKGPPSESATTPSAKPRTIPTLRPEEYLPSFAQRPEQTAKSTKRSRSVLSVLLQRLSITFEGAIGFCLVAGALCALYFMLLFPASSNGADVSQERLTMKQNGVIVGMGLVLLGGLLIVAKQIKQLPAASRSETGGKIERR